MEFPEEKVGGITINKLPRMARGSLLVKFIFLDMLQYLIL